MKFINKVLIFVIGVTFIPIIVSIISSFESDSMIISDNYFYTESLEVAGLIYDGLDPITELDLIDNVYIMVDGVEIYSGSTSLEGYTIVDGGAQNKLVYDFPDTDSIQIHFGVYLSATDTGDLFIKDGLLGSEILISVGEYSIVEASDLGSLGMFLALIPLIFVGVLIVKFKND